MTDAAEKILAYPTPRDPASPFLPSPELRALNDAGVALTRVQTWDGRTPWLILSHAAQRQIMADPRVSANDHLPNFPHPTQAQAETIHDRPKTIFDTDGEEHTRIRRMLTNSFTRHRMEKIRPQIQKVTDELIDKMLAGPKPTDLVEALSVPLPSLMICDLLGVPYQDHEFFEAHAKVANAREKTAEENNASTRALGVYISGLIQAKMDRPEEDVVSDLGTRVKAGDLTLDHATLLGVILLIAGHETSANMITLATALLLQNPDQLALLRDTDDQQVVASSVEELLRYLTIPHLLQRRIALEDIEIAGVTIHAGDGIIAPLPAANFDPAAFPNPDKLDLVREARHHHAFGWGPHQCIGQQLARIELQVVYPTLLRRVPTLKLAVPFEELRFKHDSLAYGIYELPVTW
ncbi:cytochrome P450 [Rhizobium rhizogenes]|uniref:cytochrome P450 n=1 Tax=Rhizobium rhizogenes TaxID=359 RepID=UPI00157317FC|nr:cytochrome P450 [Rhizobium rhizogenes]NTH23365.1 cytochrome P450 [Rhizobium rhizogenes]NTH36387.1 cytochrome P450 [Rhizobium rhizogenes]